MMSCTDWKVYRTETINIWLLLYRQNIKSMIKDITVAKEEIKKNGMTVDGRKYQINFTGLIYLFSLFFNLCGSCLLAIKFVRAIKKWKLSMDSYNFFEDQVRDQKSHSIYPCDF